MAFTAAFIAAGQVVVFVLGLQHFARREFFNDRKELLDVLSLLFCELQVFFEI